MTNRSGEGKNKTLKFNARKQLKLTKTLVLSFVATIKRETQNYPHLIKRTSKGSPLQNSFLIYLPAASLPPKSTIDLRQRGPGGAFWTVTSLTTHAVPSTRMPFLLHLGNWCSQSPFQEACTDRPSQGKMKSSPHGSNSNRCFPLIQPSAHYVIIV